MSATGRSDVRHEHDTYLTPNWCTRRFLEAYRIPSGTILDPCAASGGLLSVVREMRPDCTPVGIELRPECLPDLKKVCGGDAVTVDFLKLARGFLPGAVDCVLTNFPFSLAEEFLSESLRIAKVVITLQRINWIRGNGRHATMAKLRPGLFVLPDRPTFTGYGTDATEYSFFVFGDPAVAGTWTMLGSTPEAERSAWSERMRAIYPKPVKKRKQKDQNEQHKEAA
jgi:hypothetical protein